MVRRVAQTVMNKMLGLDPEVQESFGQFAGKVVKIEITDLNSITYLRVADNGFDVLREFEGEIQATIRGTVVALGQLGVQQFFNDVGSKQSVSIEGDLEFVQQLLQLSKKYRFDWEEILAKAFGDVIGHQMGNGLRGVANWLRGSAQKFQWDISEFVQDEARVTPSQQEVDIFYNDVDALRHDVERMHVKFNRLLGD